MRCLIQNANLVLPENNKIIEDSSLIIENGLIIDIFKGIPYKFDFSVDVSIDARQGYVIAGIINHHTHGISLGPFGQAGSKALPLGLIKRNLNKHLLEGTTTALDLDSFSTPEEIETLQKMHPIKIKYGTSHTRFNLEAAEYADGKGLNKFHKGLHVEEMISRGAVVIGEVGGGSTLGGASANYLYLPSAIEEKTGRTISVSLSTQLNKAVLGRHMDLSSTNKMAVQDILSKAMLADVLTVDEAIEIVKEFVYSSVEVGRKGIREAAQLAIKYDIPIIVHNASATMEVMLEIAEKLGSKLIAAHSNHPSYENGEMIRTIKDLRKHGAIIDICCGDFFGAKQIFREDDLKLTLQLLYDGLGDVLSTDFMGGNWDPMLQFIEKAVQEKALTLPEAIGMVTCKVTDAIPKLAPNCAKIEPGKVADLVILDSKKISSIRYVLVNGLIVCKDNNICNIETGMYR